MSRSDQPPEKILVIRDIYKGKPSKIETWRYWSIVEDLGWRGVEREKAHEIAKWAGRAKIGEEQDIGKNLKLKIK